MNRILRTFVLILSVAAATQARGSKASYHPPAQGTPLEKFANCAEMQAHLAQHAALPLKRHDGRRGKGLRDRLPSSKDSRVMQEKAASPAKAKAGMTGTNNQVQGLEESDFIKAAGSYFYHVSGAKLRVVKNWPASKMDTVSEYNFAGDVREIQVEEDYLVAIGGGDHYGDKANIYILDITDKKSIREHTRFRVPGMYKTSRLHDGKLRVVVIDSSAQITSTPIKEQKTKTKQGWVRWGKQAKPNLRYSLKIQSAEHVSDSQSEDLPTIHKCRNVYMPASYPGNLVTRIATINLKDRTFAEDFAFTNTQHVYASPHRLYLASTHYNINHGFYNATRLDAFDLGHDLHAPLLASGLVGGSLLNQFAMDEYKGVLRVALTGNRNGRKNKWFSEQKSGSINFVQTLKARGNEFKTIGSTTGLAPGERIYAVRFDGDQGYVVTFRQVDPLYTIDLRNPERPRMLGELKVPGYSTYIHMLDENHLLTIGQDADPKTGRALGLKLSVFDVRNRQKPREVQSLLFHRGAASEASVDHKAFTFHREKGVLAIPATNNIQGDSLASLLLFKVTTREIEPMGEVEMSDMAVKKGSFSTRQASAQVRRSFFRGDIVYAVGQTGIRAARIDRPAKPINSLYFDRTLTSQIMRRW